MIKKVEKKVKIASAAWKRLAIVGWLTWAWAETMTIFAAVQAFEPKQLWQTVTCVIIIASMTARIGLAIKRRIRSEFEIIYPALIKQVPPDFYEHGEGRTMRLGVREGGAV